MRVYMRPIENKIETDPAQPRHLVTELVSLRLQNGTRPSRLFAD